VEEGEISAIRFAASIGERSRGSESNPALQKFNAKQDSRFRSYFAMVRGFSNRIW